MYGIHARISTTPKICIFIYFFIGVVYCISRICHHIGQMGESTANTYPASIIPSLASIQLWRPKISIRTLWISYQCSAAYGYFCSLNENQKRLMRRVSKGHNVCVSGGPGTGKTLLSMTLVECLQALVKKLLVTKTTGLSASQLPGGLQFTVHLVCWMDALPYRN